MPKPTNKKKYGFETALVALANLQEEFPKDSDLWKEVDKLWGELEAMREDCDDDGVILDGNYL